LTDLIHSHSFKKWLALVTGLEAKSLIRQSAIARRFRRGKDYALAHPYESEAPKLEFTISITPSDGWGKARDVDGEEDRGKKVKVNGHVGAPNGYNDETRGKGKAKEVEKVQVSVPDEMDLGGEEVYMAGEDEEAEAPATLPSVGRKAVHDPAVYNAGDDDDDGILFTNPASWNRFSIVLRDKGTLRFVKYVSHAAQGDRWDLKGEVEVDEAGWVETEGDEDEEAGEEGDEGDIEGDDDDDELDDDDDDEE
jgi:hypothetical protein